MHCRFNTSQSNFEKFNLQHKIFNLLGKNVTKFLKGRHNTPSSDSKRQRNPVYLHDGAWVEAVSFLVFCCSTNSRVGSHNSRGSWWRGRRLLLLLLATGLGRRRWHDNLVRNFAGISRRFNEFELQVWDNLVWQCHLFCTGPTECQIRPILAEKISPWIIVSIAPSKCIIYWQIDGVCDSTHGFLFRGTFLYQNFLIIHFSFLNQILSCSLFLLDK